MARESMSDCPSPTVPGSGHMSFADEDVIEDEEVEQASRNIASIDSKLAIFEVKIFSTILIIIKHYLYLYIFVFRIKVYL